jgi:aryl-alcohol dehydrogenase (NADP+)
VLSNPAITSPIVGASHPEQLAPSLSAVDVALDGDLRRRLDELTRSYRLGDALR